MESEVTPFSFAVQSGAGEELRGAAHAYTPDVTAKIFQILDENERCSINITSIIYNHIQYLPLFTIQGRKAFMAWWSNS